MSAAKKDSKRKGRSSAALTDEAKALYRATIDHVAANCQKDSAKLLELRFLLEDTIAGQNAIKVSIATLQKFHEPGIPDAILMPMAIGIMIGIHISETAHKRTTRPNGNWQSLPKD